MPDTFDSPLIDRLIDLALDEDVGGGDITSALSIPSSLLGSGAILAKESFVFCGGALVERIFAAMKCEVLTSDLVPDGTRVEPGRILGTIAGSVRGLLAGERTVLNFLQRLSGIATHTNTFVEAARPNIILDTRKTTPGWRHLEKYAVLTGGGRNHRSSLSDMILVKNNHVDACGGDLEEVLRGIYGGKPPSMKVEVEVRDMKELSIALGFKPDVIMLDNWRDETLREAVTLVRSTSSATEIELSGGMTLERVGNFSDIAPVLISVGALTTKAVNVDISLRITASHGL